MSTSSHSGEIKDAYDVEEKGAATAPHLESGAEVVSAHDGVNRDKGVIGWLWKVAMKLDSYGVEVRGVERVPPNERHHTGVFDAGYLWASANMTISTFSLGTLGNSIWELQGTDACLTILFFNLLTTLPVAVFSCWGKSTGLRQMILGRFSFGPWTILFPIALNCLACIGWSTINTIVGASALKAVSDTHQLPEPVGIIIIALITLVVSLFGYRYVHAFERYGSVPIFVIFCIMFGQAGKYMHGGMGGVGEAEAASVLSFGGTIAGFALGWTSLAADYTVNFPAETPDWKVFLSTYIGLNFPLVFVECLGALMMTTFVDKTTWADAYDKGGLGGLLGAPLVGPMGGFGRFLLVVLAMSIVFNNIPNVYSFALTFQAFGKYCQAIPRFFLCIVCTAIYIALAEAGYNSFESAFDTLLVILSYWLAIYSCILLIEHYFIRRGWQGYNLDDYNNYKKLPVGIAAAVSAGFGVAGAYVILFPKSRMRRGTDSRSRRLLVPDLASSSLATSSASLSLFINKSVLGMSQTWYVGRIGGLVAPPFGMDIGFELAFGFTAITYPVFRLIERHYTGR